MYQKRFILVEVKVRDFINFITDLGAKTGAILANPWAKFKPILTRLINKIGGDLATKRIEAKLTKLRDYCTSNSDELLDKIHKAVSHAATVGWIIFDKLMLLGKKVGEKTIDVLSEFIENITNEELDGNTTMKKIICFLKRGFTRIGEFIRSNPMATTIYAASIILLFALYSYVVGAIKIYIAILIGLSLAPYAITLIPLL